MPDHLFWLSQEQFARLNRCRLTRFAALRVSMIVASSRASFTP